VNNFMIVVLLVIRPAIPPEAAPDASSSIFLPHAQIAKKGDAEKSPTVAMVTNAPAWPFPGA
jgi:hypothetical protein